MPDYTKRRLFTDNNDNSSSGDGVNITNITYSALLALKTAGTMTIGYYRITDYRTMQLIPNTTVTRTGSLEPLIIFATSASTLDIQVYSVLYPTDYIEYDLIDATTENPGGGVSKGRISFRKETVQDISAYTDWRNVKYRRWETSSGNGTYTALTDPGGGEAHRDFFMFGNNINTSTNTFTAVINGNTPSSYYRFNLGLNLSPYNAVFGNTAGGIHIQSVNESTISNGFILNNIADVSQTIIGPNCEGNTLYQLTTSIIGSGFFSNGGSTGSIYGSTIGNNCSFNSICGIIESTIIGTGFSYNNSNGFNNCTIGNDFSYNSVKNISSSTIGNSFSNNTIGSDMSGCNVGNLFIGNSIKAAFANCDVSDGFMWCDVQEGLAGFDFTTATIVYGDYNKTIFKRPNGTLQLVYISNTNVPTYAAITA